MDVIGKIAVPELGASVGNSGFLWVWMWCGRLCKCWTDELRNARWPL